MRVSHPDPEFADVIVFRKPPAAVQRVRSQSAVAPTLPECHDGLRC
jgi:hypothetical protein